MAGEALARSTKANLFGFQFNGLRSDRWRGLWLSACLLFVSADAILTVCVLFDFLVVVFQPLVAAATKTATRWPVLFGRGGISGLCLASAHDGRDNVGFGSPCSLGNGPRIGNGNGWCVD